MRPAVVFLVLVGCGRIAFEPHDDASPLSDSPVANSDAAGDSTLACTPLTSCMGTSQADVCNGTCFARCPDMVDYVPYAEASSRCAQWGGTPMILHSAADTACVMSFGTFGWLGIAQPTGQTTTAAGWAWIDGSPMPYTNWGSGEPNDGDTVEDDTEQCAHTYGSGLWNDRPCTSTNVVPIVCTR